MKPRYLAKLQRNQDDNMKNLIQTEIKKKKKEFLPTKLGKYNEIDSETTSVKEVFFFLLQRGLRLTSVYAVLSGYLDTLEELMPLAYNTNNSNKRKHAVQWFLCSQALKEISACLGETVTCPLWM